MRRSGQGGAGLPGSGNARRRGGGAAWGGGRGRRRRALAQNRPCVCWVGPAGCKAAARARLEGGDREGGWMPSTVHGGHAPIPGYGREPPRLAAVAPTRPRGPPQALSRDGAPAGRGRGAVPRGMRGRKRKSRYPRRTAGDGQVRGGSDAVEVAPVVRRPGWRQAASPTTNRRRVTTRVMVGIRSGRYRAYLWVGRGAPRGVLNADIIRVYSASDAMRCRAKGKVRALIHAAGEGRGRGRVQRWRWQ